MDGVLNWLWQGGLVAAAACVLLFAAQRLGANVRYAVCWAALLLIVALPGLPWVLPSTPVGDALAPARTRAMVSLPDAWWTSTLLIVAAWMAWSAVQLVRLGSAIAAISRARARSRAFPSELESVLPHWRRVRVEGRQATLVLSDSVASAAVLGWGTPMIAVAPSIVRTLEPDDLERVLIHEWAHVQRHDDVVNILQILVRVAAGWHPALWWLDRRLHVEREIACDEMTVAITGSPKSYAECLMKLSRPSGTRRPLQIAPAVFTPSGLRTRVARIVSPRRFIAPVWSGTLAGVMILVLCLASAAAGGSTLVEATAFAQPLASAPALTVSLSPDRAAPAVPAVPPGPRQERTPRRPQGRSPSPQRQGPEPPSASPRPGIEPTAPPASQEPDMVDPTHAEETASDPAPLVAPDVPSVPQTQQALPRVTAQPPRSPWSAAAAGGSSVGRKSRDAGVATAGFFTRFAHRVAGAF